MPFVYSALQLSKLTNDLQGGITVHDYQLDLIRQYCDTTGIRLRDYEKDLLCLVLENPARYDGFESKVYTEENSGRDYRDTWDSLTEKQYRISIDPNLSIYERYRHSCDGYVQDAHWDWCNAWHITDTRRIIKILQEIEEEL